MLDLYSLKILRSISYSEKGMQQVEILICQGQLKVYLLIII